MKTELVLFDGTVISVLPATPGLKARIQTQEMEKNPFNNDPYMVEVTNIEGKRMKLDRNSEEYKIAFGLYLADINVRVNARIFNHLVDAVSPTKKELLEKHKDTIDSYRALLEADDPTSDWQILVDYYLLSTPEERKTFNEALSNQLPITDEEIDAALGVFRVNVRRVSTDEPTRTGKRAEKSEVSDDTGD